MGFCTMVRVSARSIFPGRLKQQSRPYLATTSLGVMAALDTPTVTCMTVRPGPRFMCLEPLLHGPTMYQATMSLGTATSTGRNTVFCTMVSTTSLSIPQGAIGSTAYAVSGNDIVGQYTDSSDNDRGYLYHDSTYTTIDVPGAVSTSVEGISGGNVVGTYAETPAIPGPYHAFLYNGVDYEILDPYFDPYGTIGDSSFADAVSGDYVLGRSLDYLAGLLSCPGCTMVRTSRRSAFPGPFIPKPGMYPATMSSDTIETVPVSIMVSCTKSSRNLRHSFSSARRSQVGWCSS